jgi:DNA-binding HxlR family transcriptional regulator
VKRLSKTYGCPVELSLHMLGGKWKTVIMARLKEEPLRYSALRQLIPAVSDKVLTERLRDLEEQGLIDRAKAGAEGREMVYRLTPSGETLRPVLQALYAWGEGAAARLDVRFDAAERTAGGIEPEGKSPSKRTG